MLKNKILIKITGSIAAYKIGNLISKLVKNGYEVKTAATGSALKFIGEAALEGLTGYPVYTDSFERGKMMSHIDLAKWADLTILAPADANTINKFSAGIADNLVTALFLARVANKPYLIAPAMNTAMYDHPATQNSLKQLRAWGIKVLPTVEGYLACGDIGKGKLLDPDEIYSEIETSLQPKENNRSILITSGATQESIDNVRYVSNMSTGKTGAALCDYLSNQGFNVTFLKSPSSAEPDNFSKKIEFSNYESIRNHIKDELQNKKYDAVIHLAAISDYSPVSLTNEENEISLPINSKLKSDDETFTIKFKKNEKIIKNIKSWSKNKNVKLIGFKLADKKNTENKNNLINEIFTSSNADRIVFNSLDSRVEDNQLEFEIVSSLGHSEYASDPYDLAELLEKIILEEK